ncbi:MAG TPA: FtsX-like permease family protein [Calditrichia bacterium]|nr:FtsX-like permease family protein [Calditrichota bacterium]HQV31434.1 FtsX-like permease family protein [Calditrichia bacterium]
MIRFLMKGLLRDRSRSFFPIVVGATGVALTVLMQAWMNGVFNNFLDASARFQTGHLKITTRGYTEEANQMPTDLSLLGLDSLCQSLKTDFPDIAWYPRISFGGLLDIPDGNGETRAQAPAFGMGIQLLGEYRAETERLGLTRALVRGRLPREPGEILISDGFAQRLGVEPGDIATLISSTLYGSMAFYNFRISGTVHFGITAMDRGAILGDVGDLQSALDMADGAAEVLGFYRDDRFSLERAARDAAAFNARQGGDTFDLIMRPLQTQSGLSDMIAMVRSALSMMIFIFIFIMFLVLWNAGLMGSIRRYGEFGVRLAIGETHGAIYRSLLAESLAVGVVASVVGTAVGLTFAYYLETTGIDLSFIMRRASMMIDPVMRAKINLTSFWIGWFPGVVATVLGSAVSGLTIFKRQTAQLFKELEV